MSNKFIPINRKTPFVLPANLEGFSSPGLELARFIVEVVEQLDTEYLDSSYGGGGSNSYPPKMMLALLFYCYATGTSSSRGIERATYELIPVIYITDGNHPDHDTINTFRKRFLKELEDLFLQILLIAHGMGILKLGDVSIDGTKIKANASKHKAMSWDYACQLETKMKEEIRKLLDLASSRDKEKSKGIDIPNELARRESRLKKIAEIKAEIEARAHIRYEEERQEYEAKVEQRQRKEAASGKKIGGRKPQPPETGPKGKDQVNFTDGESRIMPISGGGFEQTYNAQAGVDMETMIIINQHLSQNPNDKQEVKPILAELRKLPEELGRVDRAALDNGYFSENNVIQLEEHDISPYIASGRQPHYPPLEERLNVPPKTEVEESAKDVGTTTNLEAKPTKGIEAMQERMKTPEGKEFYAKRKTTIEPVFGIIKNVMGFRQFMLRGLDAVRGEWNLVCIAFNLKRLYTLSTS